MADQLLARAVQTLSAQCDGANQQDGLGFNGPDSRFGNPLAAVSPEAWSEGAQRAAWEMLAKYRTQLASAGIDYDAIAEPAKVKTEKFVRAIDVRNGKVLVYLPYGDSAYPKAALSATWNRELKGWQVAVAKYGAVLNWAKANGVPVTDRAKALLESAPTPDKPDYLGSASLSSGGEIVLRFDYNPSLVDAVRAVPGRKWNPEDKTWRVPAETVSVIRKLAEDYNLQLSPKVLELPDVDVHMGPKVSVQGRDFAITFSYDAQVLSAVRQMPGSAYSPATRLWIVPIESVDELQKFVKEFDAAVAPEVLRLIDEASVVQEVIDASAAYDAEITVAGLGNNGFSLFPFQRAGVAYAMRAMGWEHTDGGIWERTKDTGEGGVLIGDEMGLGKGHPLGTKVLTPAGWKVIEDVQAGDQLIGSNGRPTTVTGMFYRGTLPVYKVTLNDGASVRVDGDHLWAVGSVRKGKWEVKETRTLMGNLRDAAGNSNWKIPMVEPVEYISEPLPLNPYLLGVLLGDGGISTHGISLSTPYQEIIDRIRRVLPVGLRVARGDGNTWHIVSHHVGAPNAIRRALDGLGLRQASAGKFIPEPYLRASVSHRWELLRGLMDADGHAGRDGCNEISTTSTDLASGIIEVVESLGGTVRTTVTKTGLVRLRVRTTDCPFALTRKAQAWVKPSKYPPSRIIKDIEPDGQSEVICLSVDAPDHLYVTERHIVTHNTSQGLAVLQAAQAFPAVIICPASLKLNWEREIGNWLPKDRVVKVLTGTSGNLPDADLYICNYDVLHYWAEKFGAIKGLVLDESHYVKNGAARRTKACVALSDKVESGGVRLCLSGTPIVNQPLELMTQLRIIHRLNEFGGASQFRNTYGRSSAKSLASLNRKLRSMCYVRRRKADVLTELPPKRWSIVMVEGDPAIMKEYKKAEADIIRYLADLARKIALESGADTEEARRAAIVKSIRARAAEQLVAITTLKQLAAKAKAKVAREWVDNFLANDKKLIVFGWHREIVDDIATNFAGGIKIQGGISAVKRQEAVDLFQNSDEQKVIACQIKAAGVGLTLTAASDVLFIEQGWTPGEMDQAVDRSHRIGQQDSVTGWVMIVAETIDEDIARLIEHKRSVVDRAIDGSNLDDEELQQSAETELLVMLAERGLEEDADF